MGLPRGHVNLLDFTTDRAPTQRYIYSVTSLRMDRGWMERGIAKGKNKEEESKLLRCEPKRCEGESDRREPRYDSAPPFRNETRCVIHEKDLPLIVWREQKGSSCSQPAECRY